LFTSDWWFVAQVFGSALLIFMFGESYRTQLSQSKWFHPAVILSINSDAESENNSAHKRVTCGSLPYITLEKPSPLKKTGERGK
jgi:hypothetical protein